MSEHRAFIGLGSNLAAPLTQVTRAVQELAELPHSRLLEQSPWYRSPPMGPADQPDFINGAVLLATGLSPLALLRAMQAIELAHERRRERHWGPRTLDLDLLLYDDLTLQDPQLQIPHPGLRQRNFVLYPLADIDPQLTLPSGEPIASLLAQCPATGLTRLNDSTGARRE